MDKDNQLFLESEAELFPTSSTGGFGNKRNFDEEFKLMEDLFLIGNKITHDFEEHEVSEDFSLTKEEFASENSNKDFVNTLEELK